MSEDFDKREWQAAEELAEKARLDRLEKTKKAKARAARKAQRKLEKLAHTLKESGDLTDWEEEFAESVTERLEQYGSAFHDPEKGSPADALSYAQKHVISALGKKARAEMSASKPKGLQAKKGFGRKQAFTPRVRHIDDEIPNSADDSAAKTDAKKDKLPKHHNTKRPFLRLVQSEDDT